eukprot:GHUV01055275.1.p1 GENE.GHUV01055275.1~~GHUV01055275.1.p1  ORF type:complete len:311 (+),score=100.50 GHUV01055275.1:1067-1999(+)
MAAKGGPEARDDFLTRQQRLQEQFKGVDAARSSVISKGGIADMSTQPAFLTGGKLRDYQLEGINWLTRAWIKSRNCILADEMGLGKTVQCVSFLGLLAETCGVRGPFLVVVPLSTVPNWIKEFRKWVPMLNALVYVGNGRSREVIRAFEFGGSFALPGSTSSSNRSRPYNFEVLITTYELVLKDAALLGKINWAYMMVDEAHRLKNSESALYQVGDWCNIELWCLPTWLAVQHSCLHPLHQHLCILGVYPPLCVLFATGFNTDNPSIVDCVHVHCLLTGACWLALQEQAADHGHSLAEQPEGVVGTAALP